MRLGTIKQAADQRDVSPSTYRRGARKGIYAPIIQVSPGRVAVDPEEDARRIRAIADGENPFRPEPAPHWSARDRAEPPSSAGEFQVRASYRHNPDRCSSATRP